MRVTHLHHRGAAQHPTVMVNVSHCARKLQIVWSDFSHSCAMREIMSKNVSI
jgi:hypothetical protein